MSVNLAKKKAEMKKEGKKRAMSRTTIDKKTGRVRVKDREAVAAAKKGAAKRRGKVHSAATKKKISLAMKKMHRTGKTKTGRASKFNHHVGIHEPTKAQTSAPKVLTGSSKVSGGSKPPKVKNKKLNVPTSGAQRGGGVKVKTVVKKK